MISVIHPTSHFGPTGSSAGSRVGPTFPGFTGQTALMASHDQISDLYRRRSSGYTHHVSNSASWLGGISGVSAETAPQPPSQPQPQRAVSSRSLSSYSSVSTMVTPVSTSLAGSNRLGAASSNVAKSRGPTTRGLMAPPPGKDFSKPLFVDCSIEYELPNAPKIPKNSLPILMVDQRYQQKQKQRQQQQQQQQLLMNIKNKEANKVNSRCKNPNCHCQKQVLKTGMKRSYSNAMGSQQPQYFKLPQQQQQQQQQLQQQKNHQQHHPAPHHHAYFEATPTAVSEAKRSRLMAEHQQKQQQQHQQQLLQQYKQQQHTFFQAQMQAAAALRHYQQSFGYRGYGGPPCPHPPTTSSATSISRPTAAARPAARPAVRHADMRISSFQQITPPESLAFWQQQQQLTSSVCRSAYCSGVTGTPATGAPYPPTGACCPTPRLCCYAMPYPTPAMVTDPSCLCCAQGKNQQVNVNKENLGIMRSL